MNGNSEAGAVGPAVDRPLEGRNAPLELSESEQFVHLRSRVRQSVVRSSSDRHMRRRRSEMAAGLDYGRSKGLTWHTIRHEFVSRNIENTGDPVVTQKLARHKDNRTTQGYMHARESRVLAAAVKLDRR